MTVFDTDEFNHVAYAYRAWPGHDPKGVVAAFERLKDFCKAIAPSSPADRQGFEPFEYTERN